MLWLGRDAGSHGQHVSGGWGFAPQQGSIAHLRMRGGRLRGAEQEGAAGANRRPSELAAGRRKAGRIG